MYCGAGVLVSRPNSSIRQCFLGFWGEAASGRMERTGHRTCRRCDQQSSSRLAKGGSSLDKLDNTLTTHIQRIDADSTNAAQCCTISGRQTVLQLLRIGC
jgi:hypothetical protein